MSSDRPGNVTDGSGIEVFSDDFRSYKEIANLSYDDFVDNVTELNELASHFLDSNGKLLVFAVKKGTDTTPLWKGTVRVACCKVDANTKEVDSYRVLTLKQFLAIFKSLQTQTAALREDASSADSSPDTDLVKVPGVTKPHPLTTAKFSASVLLEEALGEEASSLDECCVCLERKPDLILPCAHAYCVQCPVHRAVEREPQDLPHVPGKHGQCGERLGDQRRPRQLDIATQIQKSLMELAAE